MGLVAEQEPKTVVQYVLSRLKDHGLTDIFGVPGDYVYPVLDAIIDDPDIAWRGNCNELNAGYAADGYARIRGLGVYCQTYGSELGSYLALAGAYGERSPVIMITGYPSTAQQASRQAWHHMLGSHRYDLFVDMAEELTVARAILTPDNCIEEFERVLAAVLYHQKPGLLAFPSDLAHAPITSDTPDAIPLADPTSDPAALRQAVDHIAEVLSGVSPTCIVPGLLVQRLGLIALATKLVDATNLPFTTPYQDATTLDETHPNYMGIWQGQFANPAIDDYVNRCAYVLALSPDRHFFNTGFNTLTFPQERSINVNAHHVRVGRAVYDNVEMKDVLEALIDRLPRWEDQGAPNHVTPYTQASGSGDDPIDAGDPLYARLQAFLRPGDIVVGDPSSPALAATTMQKPKDCVFESQALAASIGWGTPAALGCAVAAPDRRVVIIAGDGAHQIAAQEIGQFYKFGLKPVFIVVNNDGYLVERYTCRDPESSYNDLPKWRYHQLPAAFGCEDWYCVRVETTAELDAALAEVNRTARAAYIEVVTDRYSMPPGAEKLFELTRPKFGQTFTWEEWISAFRAGKNIAAPG
ncbi:alpha-keto acid decarboxylase family protein [Bauldia sp.]|uniref:alpha-keto acid decarboxylase family protein n=1 Tax=Bauldia sp. TaxID=2575872 RepID=UPI003BAA6B67